MSIHDRLRARPPAAGLVAAASERRIRCVPDFLRILDALPDPRHTGLTQRIASAAVYGCSARRGDLAIAVFNEAMLENSRAQGGGWPQTVNQTPGGEAMPLPRQSVDDEYEHLG